MIEKKNMKPLSVALGTAVTATLATVPAAQAADNPFGMTQLSEGYMVASEGKCGGMKDKEGKCGEGKCGGEKAKKAKEGKCGEGKCGGDKAKKEKAKEGKCGEGKCGGSK